MSERGWVCIHGVDIEQRHCPACRASLDAFLAASRAHSWREREAHAARFGYENTIWPKRRLAVPLERDDRTVGLG